MVIVCFFRHNKPQPTSAPIGVLTKKTRDSHVIHFYIFLRRRKEADITSICWCFRKEERKDINLPYDDFVHLRRVVVDGEKEERRRKRGLYTCCCTCTSAAKTVC